MGQGQTGHHKHTYDSGDTYDGEFVHGKRCGHGVYMTAAGLRYEGEWKDDKREGYGICTYVAKDIDGSSQWTGTYEGEWKQNLKSGSGTYQYVDGSRYAGQWSEDQKHHVGILIFPNKDTVSPSAPKSLAGVHLRQNDAHSYASALLSLVRSIEGSSASV
jgi:hypothetical protein